MVEHQPKVKGLSPNPAAGTGWEKNGEKCYDMLSSSFYCYAEFHEAFLYHIFSHFKQDKKFCQRQTH